jgi:flavorubredoxin
MGAEGVVTQIGPDLYRLSIYAPAFELQFNHFLVVDEEPLLYHAGLKGMFAPLREAVARVLDPSRLRWVGFSHFESDECGGLNDWLGLAPEAQPLCSDVGAMVSVDDFSSRPARGLADGETMATGKYRFRACRTPHLPHGWDAFALFEETHQTLFCSDLFHQLGDVEPLTTSDVVGRSIEALRAYQAGVLADYAPYTSRTAALFEKLAALGPKRLAIMHGSSFEGDGAGALVDLAAGFRDVLGGK